MSIPNFVVVMPFDIPILFVIFNRPDTTQRVFDEIRKQQPKYLYVAADGPRINRPEDENNCKLTREIIHQIDWDCNLNLLFRDANLGCGNAVYTAISWFFENVEMGIVLEDDCIPHSDFFPYCKELLFKYQKVEQIKWIAGNNCNIESKLSHASYYFSKYPHVWGWASWRRVWKDYKFDLNGFPKNEIFEKIDSIFSTCGEKLFWKNRFEIMKSNKVAKKRGISAWDYQNVFSMWMKDGLAILPQKNLITNIGFGSDATHTITNNNQSIPSFPILPIIHNFNIIQDKEADLLYYKNFVYKPLWKYPLLKVKLLIDKLF